MPGEYQHVYRPVADPVDEMVQEIQQARVGVLRVLDQQHDRSCFRETLEEQPPPREQFLPSQCSPGVAREGDAQQPAQPHAGVCPFTGIGDEPVQSSRQLA